MTAGKPRRLLELAQRGMRSRELRAGIAAWIAAGCAVYEIGHGDYFLGDSNAKSFGLLLAATVAFRSLWEL